MNTKEAEKLRANIKVLQKQFDDKLYEALMMVRSMVKGSK